MRTTTCQCRTRAGLVALLILAIVPLFPGCSDRPTPTPTPDRGTEGSSEKDAPPPTEDSGPVKPAPSEGS